MDHADFAQASGGGGERGSVTRQEAKQLQRDYIPNGSRVDEETVRCLVYRALTEGEIHRCGWSDSYDPQSGPIFCGQVADWMAPVANGETLYLCAYHRERL